MNRLIAPSVVVSIFTMILYYISVAVAADVIDTPLQAGLTSGAIPGLDAALYFLVVETAVLALAFYVAVIATFKSRVAAALGIVAIVGGLVAMLLIATIGLVTYGWFAITMDNWIVVPLLFNLYVIRNPAAGIAIQGVLFVACFAALMKINEIDNDVQNTT